MPNQRDPDKELLGGYVPKPLKAKVEKVAKKHKKTLSEVLHKIVEKGVDCYDKEQSKEANEKKGLTVFNTFCNLATA
ncbi:MAG: hypothetical protein INR69_19075 [Mucilaginibacter polytrichastri]|nr:hypothetical protein [Mucilaginibacter polytrichastri]